MNSEFWSSRYKKEQIGWDIGYPSTPIKEYIDKLTDKSLRLLIPGSGNAYEAEYLWNLGFRNTFVLDFSPVPLRNLKSRVPNFPEDQLICGDFFSLVGEYDIIFEQTFFCALPPEMRDQYVSQMARLLHPKGKLIGLLFDFPLTTDGPPFGGDEVEYRQRFSAKFNIVKLERCHNSIPPRSGTELFFIMKLK